MQDKYIFINFDDSWKYSFYDISSEEKRLLEEGIKFYYNEETTIKDLFLLFNKKFDNLNQKQNEIAYDKINTDRNLKYLYRLVYDNDLIFIFDLRTKIQKIIDVFNSKTLTILLTIFIEKGAIVHNEKGMRFYIHSKESGKHHLPHIHVVYNENEASIALNGEKLAGYLPKKKLEMAKEIIEVNKESLLWEWNTLSDGQKFYFKNNELIRVF